MKNVFHALKGEKKKILHKIKRRKANSIGHALCRNRFLKHSIAREVEGKIEAMGR